MRPRPVKIAWFSPMPPSVSGIAAYSADVLPALREQHHIDVFVEAANVMADHKGPPHILASPVDSVRGADLYGPPISAHDFVWKHRRQPYDLTVYQLGNAACHDYMWAFLFRYPGLTVLHDAQLHQARALALTRRWQPRLDDYLEEFRANHPDAPSDLAYLVAAGLGGTLFQHWPLVRLVVESARVTAVHNLWLADNLQTRFPASHVRYLPMGVPEIPVDAEAAESARSRLGLPADAIVFTAFGGVTEAKRVPLVLEVIGALAAEHPQVHLLLVGDAPGLDRERAAAEFGAPDQLHITGFVDAAEARAMLLASDVCLCLRWPSNRETSASWLRCLAAGRCTVVTDLTHNHEVPVLDPRTWATLSASTVPPSADPVAIAIDPLDERHSLQLAVRRLLGDRMLRRRLGRAAHGWWQRHHRLETTVAAYLALLDEAVRTPAPAIELPSHLAGQSLRRAHVLAAPFGDVAAARVAEAVPPE